NDHTLAIASSYSGNTEETLSSLEQVQESGAVLVAISTGGELARRAKASNTPTVPIKYDSQPRAALGHSLVLLLGVLQKANLIADKSGDVEEAVGVMRKLQAEISAEVPTAENPAKQLAIELRGKLPIVYGAGYLSEVARRWKGQFNENAKNWSFFEILPELNHNAVLGYQFPAELAQHLVVITLRSHLDHPRNRKRADVTQEMLKQRGVRCRTIESRGDSPLAVMLSSIHFGDYVSYYLALLNGADPTTVDAISYLKKRLAEMK
ncbi:MAG: bifunctional phosphoglucose/phosphomannose isomerase, partial [Anaerolineae bacterium]|nr:bifunctional phosphoglucose/phosphomannose isomerase [Anaerolineae bacterium]